MHESVPPKGDPVAEAANDRMVCVPTTHRNTHNRPYGVTGFWLREEMENSKS